MPPDKTHGPDRTRAEFQAYAARSGWHAESESAAAWCRANNNPGDIIVAVPAGKSGPNHAYQPLRLKLCGNVDRNGACQVSPCECHAHVLQAHPEWK